MEAEASVKLKKKWHFLRKPGQWMRFIVLALGLFIASPVNAGSVCQELLTDLQPHLDYIEPVLGTPIEIISPSLSSELRVLIQEQGGELHFLGSGSFGKVYRWQRPDNTTIVVKDYFTTRDSISDDNALELLRLVSESDDYVRVIKEVQPKLNQLRFYHDLQGVTLDDLEKEHALPESLRAGILEAYSDYISKVLERLRALNPAGKIFYNGKIILVQFSGGPLISIGLHKRNLLFDTKSGRLWVIDPY